MHEARIAHQAHANKYCINFGRLHRLQNPAPGHNPRSNSHSLSLALACVDMSRCDTKTRPSTVTWRMARRDGTVENENPASGGDLSSCCCRCCCGASGGSDGGGWYGLRGTTSTRITQRDLLLTFFSLPPTISAARELCVTLDREWRVLEHANIYLCSYTYAECGRESA